MSIPDQEFDVTVSDDGSAVVSAEQLARMGVTPGQRLHLRLMPTDDQPKKRRSARGIGVGKVPADELLSWSDFEAIHDANVNVAEQKYGDSQS